MDPVSVEMERQVPGAGAAPFRPSASMWLWRPWYAKVWWVAIAIYWCGKLASYWSEPAAALYSIALAGYLNIIFFPTTVLLVLGARFVLAWMEYSGWEWVTPSHDEMFPKRSIGGYLDPVADPLDPRSPKYRHRRDHN